MKTIRGLHLEGGSFALDDTRFTDCSFTGCTLSYSGQPVILERTALRGCRYLFSGTAKMTVEFLDCIGMLPTNADEVIYPMLQ